MNKIVFALLILTTILVTACDPVSKEFIDDYNNRLTQVSELRETHDYMINQINTNVSTVSITKLRVTEYINWTEKYEPVFVEFKEYNEKHKAKIKKTGADANAIIEDLNEAITLMNQNLQKFKAYLSE